MPDDDFMTAAEIQRRIMRKLVIQWQKCSAELDKAVERGQVAPHAR